MSWENNFFNFSVKNKWDIGWPCSPRVFALIIFSIWFIFIPAIFGYIKILSYICSMFN